MKIFRSLIFVLAGLSLYAFDLEIPEGWFQGGSKIKSYEMGIDIGAGPDGKNTATIKSIDKKIDGFGTLMQKSKPDKYFGKKIRMTGLMKSKDVENWAGFWLRVDQENLNKPIAFDNMSDRPIKGDTDWLKYEIVLDVPDNASNISFGALLHGTGQIWFDNLNFEIVDNSVPSTGNVKDKPTNLNFDK